MRCHAVQQRLVAYQDDELSPGERTRVDDHLRECARCQADEDAIFAATPRPQLVVPWHIEQRLRDEVDAEILWALAQVRPAPQSLAIRWRRWWNRDTQLSRFTAAAYAILLVGAVTWGGLNWWSLSVLEAQIARPEIVDTRDRTPDANIPAEQYQPASYSPNSDDQYR